MCRNPWSQKKLHYGDSWLSSLLYSGAELGKKQAVLFNFFFEIVIVTKLPKKNRTLTEKKRVIEEKKRAADFNAASSGFVVQTVIG